MGENVPICTPHGSLPGPDPKPPFPLSPLKGLIASSQPPKAELNLSGTAGTALTALNSFLLLSRVIFPFGPGVLRGGKVPVPFISALSQQALKEGEFLTTSEPLQLQVVL